jgi:sulfane dehydrogenase subunit SoxC
MPETDPWSFFSGLSRRAWLKRTALAAGGTLASGSLLARAAPLPVPESSKKLGAPILSPEYGQPSAHESDVVRRPIGLTPTQYSSWSFTPLQDLHGIVTPNGLFFERHHGGVPDIARDQHRLAVPGLVRQPRSIWRSAPPATARAARARRWTDWWAGKVRLRLPSR